jgi:septum formation protein
MSQIILASQSPRRVELLTKMGVLFTAIPSNYDEKLDESRSAEEVAVELALGKANDVSVRYPDAFVIGSDTVVALNGRQMEKPKDIDDAREMLTALAGHKSTVSTGVAIVRADGRIEQSQVATTTVYFKPDSPEVIKLREEYLASGDWKDKAGGYGVQSGAAILIERIDGDFDTIVGLPTSLLSKMLNNVGIHTTTGEQR